MLIPDAPSPTGFAVKKGDPLAALVPADAALVLDGDASCTRGGAPRRADVCMALG
jgi:hypothetical protein